MPHIIDGHNLIGSGLLPGIRLGDPDDEAQLLEGLRAYRARGGPEMVVFFDSGAFAPTTGGIQRVAGLEVRFSGPDQIADDAIVLYLQRQRQPGQYTVVTNDSALAQRSRLTGANVITAQQFARALLATPGSRRRRMRATPAEERAIPGAQDPAFADLYAVFVEAEQTTAAGKAAEPRDFEGAVDDLLNGAVSEAQRAARWLGTSRREEAAEPLRTALSHEEAGVRAAAALALGALGNRNALSDLVSAMQTDEHSMVREAAAQSLGRLGDRSAERALESAARSDPKSKVRRSALAALTQIRARR